MVQLLDITVLYYHIFIHNKNSLDANTINISTPYTKSFIISTSDTSINYTSNSGIIFLILNYNSYQ